MKLILKIASNFTLTNCDLIRQPENKIRLDVVPCTMKINLP